ncbi:MAG TPA: hypothetical protein VHS32_18075, partial [Streptosporangiaceae bacterium]|nr:hypothetical protein [Streptosporangiaceae bacterium]
MSGDVIVTVTLNAALHVAYEVLAPGGSIPPRPPQLMGGPAPPCPPAPISRPGYRAGGRGVTVARLLHSFGHDVLAAGLA